MPDARFTWLPISTSAVYAVTALWILRELWRVQAESSRAGH
jgi:hypothetical protein